MFTTPTATDPRAAVSFRRVSKSYGTGSGLVHALDTIDIDILAGEFTAVMGPSGSGKSTFMNVAAGLDDATRGSVFIAGQPLHAMDDTSRTMLRRRQVGFVFQSFNLVPTLTVLENIVLPFQLAGHRVSPDEQHWIDHLIHVLGLTERIGHKPAELSGGQQQRVAIARALASRPAVIFADEPTGNLDTRSSSEVLQLMRSAATDYGQTIAMVSHDPIAASYADRVIVLADGRLVADRGRMSPQEISGLLLDAETRHEVTSVTPSGSAS